jgi:hypothetical protein
MERLNREEYVLHDERDKENIETNAKKETIRSQITIKKNTPYLRAHQIQRQCSQLNFIMALFHRK